MLAAARKQDLKKTGVTVSVGDDDFSHLSYYLSCATKGVGIDILPDDLIDHRKARRLSRDRKDEILKIAYEVVDPDTVVDKIFYRDEYGLCGDSLNEFFEVTQVDTIFAIDSSVLIGGQNTQVAKIMVFKDSWLERHYHTPIKNQMRRIKQICEVKEEEDDVSTALAGLLIGLAIAMDDDDDDKKPSSSKHCSHCRGLDGDCSCDRGCPIKESTKCSKVHHCDHCKGFDAKCVCEHGCPEGIYSKCQVEHTSVLCDGCKQQDIKGARFKCADCFNFDLCEKCYNQGARKHDMTHAFHRIDRVGSDPVYLEPRHHPAPPVVSTPTRPTSTATTAAVNETAKVVTPEPDIKFVPEATATPFVQATPVVDDQFNEGDSVKLVGLKSGHMNGVTAVVAQSAPMPDGRIQVRLSEKEPGKLINIKPENLQKVKTFQPGQMVMLTGLSSKEMNGVTGMVESFPGAARVLVRLYEGKSVSIKPENLEIVADILD